jgi:RNA polymerase sigma-70 factor, ECF subfamily
MDTELDDGELMGALASGDDLALNPLMDRHGEKLFHYLIRLLRNETDAAEVAQETFVRVYQHRHTFRRNARFTTWLYTIATNLVRDRMRRAARHPHVSLNAEISDETGELGDLMESPDAAPDAQLLKEERIDMVRQAIAALPEAFRVPLILAEYEGMAQAEIAEILHCSVKAVENRLYRARQRLKERLAQCGKA